MRENFKARPDFAVDDSQWDAVMQLFETLVESTDPDAVLAAHPNPEIREAAGQLWQHHLLAAKEDFLRNTIDFTVIPVFRPGQVLAGRFEVEKMLGQGGMGEVYLASDRRLGEPVAIKTIARLLAGSPQICRHFIAEVQNARRITHPNVCRIHELFHEGETIFFVMEFVDGISLKDYLDKNPAGSREAYDIVVNLAEGLHAAHCSGVVHGDFKPSNVLIVPGKPVRAVIMDFGLARALRAGEDQGHPPVEIGAGTLEYMAPELLAGSAPSISSDVFAFGRVAQQLLPKSKVWAGCIASHKGERLVSLDGVIRALRQDQSRRYWIAGAAAAASAPLIWSYHSPNRPVVIESHARILVNGFLSQEGPAPRARLIRSLLITALQQSEKLHVIADQDLLPALRRLSPGKTFPLDGASLQGLLTEQRASHWVEGALTEVNGRLSVSLGVWRKSNREVQAQASFGDLPAVTAVAEQTALWLRKLAGESSRSLAENPSAVASYTSSVPEALEKYYEAMERYSLGEMAAAIPILEDALRLDPKFAQAQSVLGMCLLSDQKFLEALQAAEQARSLAARLPNRERAWVEAFYQEMVMDPVQMVETTRANLDNHPEEPRFQRIYGQMLCRLGRAAESIVSLQRAVDLAPENDLLKNELVLALCEAGRFEDGLTLAQASLKASQNQYLDRGLGLSLLGLGRYEEAYVAYGQVTADTRLLEAGVQILLGNVESARAGLIQELAAQTVSGNAAAQHRIREFLCGLYFLTDRLDEAREQVQGMLPLPECPAFGPQMDATAFWAARVGDDRALETVRARLERIAWRWPNGFTQAMLLHARSLQTWRRDDLKKTEAALLASLGSAFSVWTLFDLADFFAATGRHELAEEYWLQFEGRQGVVLRRWFTGAVLLGWLHRGIAAKVRGDRSVAAACASKVLRHWERQEPGVRMVQSARRLLTA